MQTEVTRYVSIRRPKGDLERELADRARLRGVRVDRSLRRGLGVRAGHWAVGRASLQDSDLRLCDESLDKHVRGRSQGAKDERSDGVGAEPIVHHFERVPIRVRALYLLGPPVNPPEELSRGRLRRADALTN